MSSRRAAVAQALLVTFLWSTSWVFIKLGLRDLPPLAFAGLRYGLGALLLLPPMLLGRSDRVALRGLSPAGWLRLAALGLALFALTQGAQFAALARLPAASVSLVLAFTPLAVALASAPLLGEPLVRRQWAGIAVFVLGASVYFGPGILSAGNGAGLAIAAVGLVANAAAALLGRAVNRREELSPLVVTAVSMAFGAAALLAVGLASEGLPRPTATGWAIVAWLATVNTAFAFTLWSRTQRRLSATDSSLLNNSMLVQVALLGWLVLGERLAPRQIVGVALVAGGVAWAQGLFSRRARTREAR